MEIAHPFFSMEYLLSECDPMEHVYATIKCTLHFRCCSCNMHIVIVSCGFPAKQKALSVILNPLLRTWVFGAMVFELF